MGRWIRESDPNIIEIEVTVPRIAVLSDVFPPQNGGSGRWLYEVYRRFPDGRVTFLVGEHDDAEAFDALQPKINVERLSLSLGDWGTFRPWSFARYVSLARKVGRVLRRDQIEVVHAARVLPEGWVAYLLRLARKIPYVVYVHGEDICAATWSREHSWMVRRVLSRADSIIANSKNTAELLQRDWKTGCQVLYPGVDCDYFERAAPDGIVRRQLGWGTQPIILTVGRLQKRKGHDVMIRAIPQIRESVPDVLYAICGDGDERESLEALVRDLGVQKHVMFMGEISDADLLCAYQQCDLFALPNREVDRDIEGFGMVLVEAQACGRPVLAGDSGGTRETMQVDETGVIVDCTDVGLVAKTVSELLTDHGRRESMGARAEAHVRGRFDWTILSEQALQLFGS